MKCLRYKSPASEKECGSSVAYSFTNAGFNFLSYYFLSNTPADRIAHHTRLIRKGSDTQSVTPFQTREYIFPISKTPPARNAHRGSGRGMPTAAAVGRKPFREGRAFCQRKEIYAMSLVVDRLLFRKQNLRLFFSAEQIID